MRILLAMSGGIDSSVVAHLLKEQGHDVVGVRFTLWHDPLAPAIAQILPSKCCNAQTVSRAASVAKKLGIDLRVVDLEQDFKRLVVDRFLDDYRTGLTPNPCVGCNREVKFGRLLQIADELGCDALATGHYARVASETLSDGSVRHLLLEAMDAEKDQSYYLHGLTQEQLRRALFPLGCMRKAEVFALAERYGVPFDEGTYRESQDLCFFPEKSPRAFLERHLGNDVRNGDIVKRDGTVVGSHEGLPFYTIGQRRGLGIGGLKIPLEVVAKEPTSNRIVVAERGTEHAKRIQVRGLSWISWKPEENEDTRVECRMRSLSQKIAGTFRFHGQEGVFTPAIAQPLPAPGQYLVLYRGKEVLGGGMMV